MIGVRGFFGSRKIENHTEKKWTDKKAQDAIAQPKQSFQTKRWAENPQRFRMKKEKRRKSEKETGGKNGCIPSTFIQSICLCSSGYTFSENYYWNWRCYQMKIRLKLTVNTLYALLHAKVYSGAIRCSYRMFVHSWYSLYFCARLLLAFRVIISCFVFLCSVNTNGTFCVEGWKKRRWAKKLIEKNIEVFN